MTAEILRRAAALMRERAEGATPGPWVVREGNVEHYFPSIGEYGALASPSDPDAQHIASWHPAVALAVARWLEDTAQLMTDGRLIYDGNALAVARAYLGEEDDRG